MVRLEFREELFFFAIIILIDIFFTIGLVKTEEDISSIFWGCVGMLGFILFGAGMTFFFIFGNVVSLKENKSLNKEIKKNKIHKNKERYYYSDRVFGFFDCCCFYEIDKAKIQNIRYDTLNSEYVLTMLDQTFMNYEFAPTQEFLIPDVFDDTELSIALGLDLPAKYMEF